MFNEYPYRNLTDLNLDWILKQIKDLTTNLEDFVKLNTVKYADPIDWNISKQYEANTVVVNEFTGVAYLSTKPVPSGVDVTNTDYWTPIFTLDFVNLNKNISLRNDGNNNNATFASVTGDWLIVGGQLYKVTQDIGVHTAYIVGFNIEIYTVELFINDYITTLNNLIGDLDELETTDKSSVVNAINELNNLIGNLDELETTDKSSVVNAINELKDSINDIFSCWVTPEDYGAVGDGLNNDSTAIQNAFNSGYNVIFTSGKTYKVDALEIRTGCHIDFNGAKLISNTGHETDTVYRLITIYNTAIGTTIDNVNIISNLDSSTVTTEDNHGVLVYGDYTTINNADISKCKGDGIYINADNVTLNGCIYVHDLHRNGISLIKGLNTFIDNVIGENINGTNPKLAVDIEPNRDEQNSSVNINSIISINCDGGALGVHTCGNTLMGNVGLIVSDNIALSTSYQYSKDSNANSNVHVNDGNVFNINKIIVNGGNDVIIRIRDNNIVKSPELIISDIELNNYTQSGSEGIIYQTITSGSVIPDYGTFGHVVFNNITFDMDNPILFHIYDVTNNHLSKLYAKCKYTTAANIIRLGTNDITTDFNIDQITINPTLTAGANITLQIVELFKYNNLIYGTIVIKTTDDITAGATVVSGLPTNIRPAILNSYNNTLGNCTNFSITSGTIKVIRDNALTNNTQYYIDVCYRI